MAQPEVQQPEFTDIIGDVATLLIRDVLPAEDRRSLFRSSWTSAKAVLHHASSTTLCVRTQRATASMQLASQARSVHFRMEQVLTVPPPALWERIHTITLHGLLVPSNWFQWHNQRESPQQLHTLRLENCELEVSNSNSNSSNTGPSSNSTSTGLPVRTLECLQCTAPIQSWRSQEAPEPSIAARALALTSDTHLRTLTYIGTGDGKLGNQMLTQKALHDSGLQAILAHPSLTHVTLGDNLQLKDSHAKTQPASLKEIHLVGGYISDVNLGALPLASIDRCTVQGDLWMMEGGPSHLPKVVPHQDKVVFEPTARADSWDPATPMFQFSFGDYHPYEKHMPEELLEAISMSTRHLSCPLVLHGPCYPSLDILAEALPATITTLTFKHLARLRHYEADAPDIEGSLINFVPDHVTHVVLSGWAVTLEDILQIISDLTRRVKITFHNMILSPSPPPPAPDGEEQEEQQQPQEEPVPLTRQEVEDRIRERLHTQPIWHRAQVELVGTFANQVRRMPLGF